MDRTCPRQNPQRVGCYGDHTRYRFIPRRDSVHAGELSSRDKVGHRGGTRVRDCRELCGGIPCPRGSGVGYKVVNLSNANILWGGAAEQSVEEKAAVAAGSERIRSHTSGEK